MVPGAALVILARRPQAGHQEAGGLIWSLSLGPEASSSDPGLWNSSLEPRSPEIAFATTFYKGVHKGFGTLPFSKNLASPAQVSPDGFRSFILLTVSDGIVCFVSPIAHFIDSIVRFVSSGAAFADSLERNRMFCVSDRSFY